MNAVVDELRRVLPGRVIDATDPRLPLADFGAHVRRTPALAVLVREESDIVAALEVATRYGIPCRVRGAGHSCAGQTLVDGGIILLNRAASPEPVLLHDDGSLETSSRNCWSWIDARARRHGRAPPVLGDWPTLTVGGTLAVGGYGVGSLARGGQVNHVTRLRLVLPSGRATWCSPTEQPDLFRYSLAGLGGLGIIERVTMRTIPRARWLSLRTYRANGLGNVADLTRSLQSWRGDSPDVFYYTGKRDRFVVGTAAPTFDGARRALPLPLFARLAQTSHVVVPNSPRLAQLGVAMWLARFPAHARIWSDFVLPAPTAADFLDCVAALRRSRKIGRYLRTIYILGIRNLPALPSIPLAPVGDPPADLAFGIGLYTMVPRHSRDMVAVRQALRHCLERCVQLGGRPYLYGWHELDRDLIEVAYGSVLGRLRELRAEHDPHGIFHSAFEAA